MWQLFLGAVTLLAFAWYLRIPALGASLFTFVVYLWSRRNPEEKVTFWFFTVPGAMLPWVMVAWSFLMGGNYVLELIGIAAAHLYYYAIDVLPRTPGPFANARSWLTTPAPVVRFFGSMHTGFAARQPGAARGANVPPQHRWGGGRRMVD